MNWINFLWPMVTGTCLTLALINLRLGLGGPMRAAHLLFSLNAFAVAFISGIELALLHAASPAQYGLALFWGDLATWLLLASLTAFIWVFFGTGKRWLALTGVGLYGVAVSSYILQGTSPAYLKITGLRTMETFGGATYKVAESEPNPWNVVTYLAVLIVLLFVVDASVRLYRRGRGRRAILVGGSLTFFLLAAGTHSALVEAGMVRTPYLISWFYLAILIAMGNELTAEVCAATKLSQQLRESEERMALAADAANLCMWVWEVAGDDVKMAEKGRALFGFNSKASIEYASILDQVHPDDRAVRRAALEQALKTKGEYEMEYRVQTVEGAVRWVSARGRCLGGVNGRNQKLLGVSMDVTERRQAEIEAARQRAELGHLSRVALVGEMATSLAHELNQPLTAIVTNARAAQRFIARGELNPTELSEMLADISDDGRRASEVIRGIKGMVRRAESKRDSVNLNEVIADVLRLVRADAVAHGCTVATELEPELPPVLGDTVQLQQVLLNLIINAFDVIRKTPCNPCRVEITSRLLDAECVEVSVRDFGPGLPAEALAKVFERFYSTKEDGMGVGLAIALSIVEAHAGTLCAENAVGGGARFWFRVPVQVMTTFEVAA
jgi:two-component system, LuxR family, sensor kinase FixL